MERWGYGSVDRWTGGWVERWGYGVTAWGFNTGGAVKSICSHALRYHKVRAGWDGTGVRSATCRRSLASS